MIGRIEGQIALKMDDAALILANGIGYKVFCTPDTLTTLTPKKHIGLWTHLAVRETALDLYGFTTREELQFFELLVGVSGIGPKSALAVLAVADVETLTSAIAEGNPSYLTTVGGIGKKTAEKIVLELREKVGAITEGETSSLRGDEEALAALCALGYSLTEARGALKQVSRDVEHGNDRLREALKILGKRE